MLNDSNKNSALRKELEDSLRKAGNAPFIVFPETINIAKEIQNMHGLAYKDRQPVVDRIYRYFLSDGMSHYSAQFEMRCLGIPWGLIMRCPFQMHSQYSPETPGQTRQAHSCSVEKKLSCIKTKH